MLLGVFRYLVGVFHHIGGLWVFGILSTIILMLNWDKSNKIELFITLCIVWVCFYVYYASFMSIVMFADPLKNRALKFVNIKVTSSSFLVSCLQIYTSKLLKFIIIVCLILFLLVPSGALTLMTGYYLYELADYLTIKW